VTQIINGRSPSGSVGRDGARASVTTRANVVATSRRVASRHVRCPYRPRHTPIIALAYILRYTGISDGWRRCSGYWINRVMSQLTTTRLLFYI